MSRAIRALTAVTVLLTACATTPPPLPAPRATTVRRVDYHRVFGGRASSSIYDPRLLSPVRMAQVLLEPSTLVTDDAEKGLESWTLRKLLQALGQRGSLVLAPPPAACEQPPCYTPQPTVALRNLRFVSGADTLSVRVTREGEDVVLALRFDPKDESLCAPDFKLRVRVVHLQAQVQILPEAAIVAVLHELKVVEPPTPSILELDLPEAAQAPEEFCAAIAAAWEAEPGFPADDARFDEAAQEVLRVALTPLYQVPEEDAPPPEAGQAPAPSKAPAKAPAPSKAPSPSKAPAPGKS